MPPLLCGLLLLVLLAVEALGQDAQMPPPARAHCRVFLVATATSSSLLVLHNAYEQDVVDVYDHREELISVLDMGTDAEQEKQKADEAYKKLQPAFQQAAQWLKRRAEPSHCYAHFVSPQTEFAASEDELRQAASRVTRRLSQLRDRARGDGKFPFALMEPTTEHRDVDSVAASGELQLVSPTWRRYFQAVGTNYFAGKVAPSLSPGQIEVFGLLHVDDAEAAEMVFDVRERWRRSKRQRQVSVALNTSDFYGRGYPGFGLQGVRGAVLKLQQEQTPLSERVDKLVHPCFLRDYSASVDGLNVTLAGAGDADKCLELVRKVATSSNVNCPPENFCVLGGAPQPQSFGSFYASGVLNEAVLKAGRVLEHAIQKRRDDGMTPLQPPTPSLSTLRETAKSVCALPHAEALTGEKSPSTKANEALLCLKLCYAIVFLEHVGIQDADERVHFMERFEKQPVVPGIGSGRSEVHASPTELVAWLTGAFLYLEALQRKVTFSIESELLAEQLSAGLPLGWNMSLLVFVAACCFLYMTTGRGAITGRAGRSGYHRVVNGSAKAKYKDTTQSIVFVDDARE